MKIRKWKIGTKKWNKECRESKTRVNQALRNMKKERIGRIKYKEEKKRHANLCERKQKEERTEEDNGKNNTAKYGDTYRTKGKRKKSWTKT